MQLRVEHFPLVQKALGSVLIATRHKSATSCEQRPMWAEIICSDLLFRLFILLGSVRSLPPYMGSRDQIQEVRLGRQGSYPLS